MTYSFADVAERLMARFEGKVPLDVVVRVARESEADLYRAGAPQGEALAELVERSAEQRLVDLIDRGLVAGEAGGAGGELVDGDDPTGPVPSPRPPS